MYDDIRDFPACLNGILRKHRWSLQYLASSLGYASKTSIVRILRGESSYGHQHTFFKKLQRSGMLSAEDAALLAESLEVSRVGVEATAARRIIRDLLHARPAAPPDSLKAFFSELDAADSARLIAINCTFPSLFSGLRAIFAAHGNFTFEHFFLLDSSEMAAAAALNCVSQMSYLPNYRAYSLEQSCRRRLVFGASLLCARVTGPDGAESDCLVQFSDARTPHILKAPSADGLFSFFMEILAAEKGRCAAITASCHIDSGPATFIDVFKYWHDCELNRNLYAIKPDLCANLIPTEHMRASLLDGGVMTAFPGYSESDIAHLLEVFLQCQEARFQNMFASRRAKHLLLSQSALARFCRTGLMTEHFEFMRPFSVGERIAILEHLLDQHRHNGYFTLYFWKNPDAAPIIEVDCMEGLGITAFPAVKESTIQKGYCSSIIQHPQLIAAFRDYFMDDLRLNHVLTDAGAAQFLEGLIQELKRADAS